MLLNLNFNGYVSQFLVWIVEYGIKKQYSEDEELKDMFKICLALALLPLEKVSDAFVKLILEKSEALIDKYVGKMR